MVVWKAIVTKCVLYRPIYEDQLVFSKAFKKKFGMSPKNYKTHKEMMDKFNEKQVDDSV